MWTALVGRYLSSVVRISLSYIDGTGSSTLFPALHPIESSTGLQVGGSERGKEAITFAVIRRIQSLYCAKQNPFNYVGLDRNLLMP